MINIAELLKDAPKGMKLYSPLFGEVEFAEVMDTDYVPIRVIKRGYGLRFDEYGRYMGNEYPDSECLLFPSKGQTWEEWKLPSKPKFKVGDSLQSGSYWARVRRIDTEKQWYICDFDNVIPFEEQELWSLVPNSKPHYDISNFKAFDKVLVRDTKNGTWKANFFSRYSNEKDDRINARFLCVESIWIQCIPYEGNEHLLGTTDMPDEMYVNW